MHSGVVFGGVSQHPQVEALTRGIDVLIATPGRLNDLINQGYIHLDGIEIFVLDEADRMLDMGFIHDVKKTIKLLPTQRQTMLFSATMPSEIETLAQTLLKNPAMIKVDPVTRAVESIDQSVYMVDKPNKTLLLAELFRTEDIKNALVFTNTKHGADRVVQKLAQEGFVARAIHGDKAQNARQDALKSFRDGRVKILVATDIAARGIDIPELSHVINYDLPDVAETYIHRIGRTGRAGLGGTAISFCNIDHVDNLRSIEKMTGLKIPVRESQWPMQVFVKTVKQPRPPRTDKQLSSRQRFSGTAKPKQRNPER
jgi:ATP-dependent RNA helicase RhlE